MKTFKVLGILLSYPQPGWLAHLPECETLLIEEKALPGKHLRGVLGFIDHLAKGDLYALQEEYVATFDRGRSHSLHLFEHIHGESRDRGQAMVNLAATYEARGFVIDQAELPDYVPLFLEFLSLCPSEEALALLGEPVDIIATIAARLKNRGSVYAVLFDSLLALSRVKPQQPRIEEAVAMTPEDDSLESLDREWEEAAAFAGPPGPSDCRSCMAPADGLNIKITQ